MPQQETDTSGTRESPATVRRFALPALAALMFAAGFFVGRLFIPEDAPDTERVSSRPMVVEVAPELGSSSVHEAPADDSGDFPAGSGTADEATQPHTTERSVKVPDAVGQWVETAQARLREAGLEAEIVQVETERGSEERVLSLDPPAGSSVSPGEIIEVRIPARPAPREVPAVPSTVPSGHESMSVLKSVPAAGKTVALTIDLGDTATRQSVTEILDELNSRGVTCTFFVTGWFIENYPELVDQINARGHDIGNHTDTHPDCTTLSTKEFRNELKTVEELMAQRGLSMTRPKYYRPPFGEYNDATTKAAADLGYRTVYWSATSVDWDTSTDPNKATRRVLSGIGPGGIILTHATKVSRVMIPQVIDDLESQGYTVTSLNGLMQAAGVG